MSGVVVSGWGVVSPLGDLVGEPMATSLAAGARPAVRERLDSGAEVTLCRVPEPWPEVVLAGGGNMRPVDRTGRLACAAAQLAIDHAGLSGQPTNQPAGLAPGLVLGTLFGGLRTIAEFDRRALTQGPMYASPLDFANSVINAAAGQTAIWHYLEGPNATIAGGATASLQAIAWALDLIEAGERAPILAGGAEEISPDAVLGFAAVGALANGAGPQPFDANRCGSALGEGAALLVLEDHDGALARGATIRGRVRGAAGTFDPSRGSDLEAAVESAERAIRQALEYADVTPSDVALVSSGASGSLEDRIEALALLRVLPETPVVAVKSQLGESHGAAGAIAAVVALEILAGASAPAVDGLEQLDPAWTNLRVVRSSGALSGKVALVTARADGATWAVVLEGAGER